MPTLPDKIIDRIQWLENRVSSWRSNATQIGLTAQQTEELGSAVATARAAFNEAQIARDAAKNATLNQTSKVASMTALAADAIRFIRAYAISRPTPSEQDQVYQLASVPPPSAGSPIPPPGVPTDMTATLNPDGSLTLKFKCVNPVGGGSVFYTVRRRIDATQQWSIIGGTGSKAFIDSTVPAGSPSIQYQIQAQRGSVSGPQSQVFIVGFGLGDGATVRTEDESGDKVMTVRMAA